MKIRWKFFIILLTFSFTPLVVVTLINQEGTDRLGRSISENSRKALAQIAYRELEMTAKNYAAIMSQSMKVVEFSLLLLSRDAEDILAGKKQGKIPEDGYFAENFENIDPKHEDMGGNPGEHRLFSDGGSHSNPDSPRQPVYHLAPGIQKDEITGELRKIKAMVPRLREAIAGFGDIFQWGHISLESGVNVSYPGHGVHFKDHDPRKTRWYRQAIKKINGGSGIIWTFPNIDTTSALLTFTASRSFSFPDGSVAGVAALDIQIDKILQESELSGQWSEKMKSFLVESEKDPETEETEFRILARRDYQSETKTWSGKPDSQWLTSSDTNKLKQLLEDLEKGHSGYMELKYDNEPAVWAYANQEKNVHFIVVVPKSVIMSIPDQAGRAVISYTNQMLIFVGFAALVLLVFLIAAAFIGSRATTRTFLEIASAAQRLADGDLSARVSLRTGDERDLVIKAFNEMGPKLEDHLRIRRALNLAQEVQQSLLPRSKPVVKGLDVSGTSVYCDETGGDYYDFFHFESETQNMLTVAAGDVSGHGIPSALLMATARALLRQRLSMPGRPARIISDVNRLLAQDTIATGHFMTLFYCEIDVFQERIRWVRAGHDAALIYDRKTDRFEELDGDGMSLGVLEDFTFEQYSRPLVSGQIIVIGTDGIWESANGDGEMFGKERFKEIIRKKSGSPASEIEAAVIQSLKDFLGDKDPTDDVTMVTVKVQIQGDENS